MTEALNIMTTYILPLLTVAAIAANAYLALEFHRK